jgi:23S rRNA pseudouridine2605 synthase
MMKNQGKRKPVPQDAGDGLVRLNKFISTSGVCSRREADVLIQTGVVRVNGKVVTELGTKVSPTDKVQYGDQVIRMEKPVYILLNKPKGYITTVEDPEKRQTVMELIRGACRERVYPVGRLDRNTMGLLLFTNDGIIAKKLTHPRYGVRKVYHVFLDQPLNKNDLQKIRDGLELEDGFIKVDNIEYVAEGADRKQVGVEIHSGKNRIVRRIFEKLEYKVTKLDRVVFAGLTKKNLPRGEWRFLEEKEINMLKMIRNPKGIK